MIRAHGVPVLDADQIARDIVRPGEPAHADIKAAWPNVVGADGAIDRKQLAARVFADPAERTRLEAITHPRIHQRALGLAGELEERGERLAFYEASLLVETNRHRDFDGLVVVTAPEAVQLARTIARDGCTPAEARARIAAQLPLADKVQTASDVIDNAGDLADTRRQVEAVVAGWRAKCA